MTDLRCCAYSFLKESSLQCDYEILTDEISSLLGYAENECKYIEELQWLNEYMYHLNGSIRGNCAINQDDFQYLIHLYDSYLSKVGELHEFVLPTGTKGASILHVIRSKCKAAVRLAYKIDVNEKAVNSLVLDSLNVFSNLMFLMARYENKMMKHKEVIFQSKSYGIDKTN